VSLIRAHVAPRPYPEERNIRLERMMGSATLDVITSFPLTSSTALAILKIDDVDAVAQRWRPRRTRRG
jgi:hypothetical protein